MAERPYRKAGHYDQRITIEQPPATQNSFGESKSYDKTLWTVWATRWARYVTAYGGEKRQSEREISEHFAYFYIVYSEARVPDSTMEVVHRGKRYQIRDVDDTEGSRVEWRLTCRLIDGEADT